ncbi:MAG TPA: twin-arginine translocase TatA/TatE family subunit [Dehalococcoidia bacterium]|nr:twin-arginine translocase TatA/TatE family subunit [Dehalococcoidia bacterium]
MPFRLGLPEIVIILVIVLIIFGVGKLPQIGGAIGKSLKEFRKAKNIVEDDDKKEDDSAAKVKEEELKKEG